MEHLSSEQIESLKQKLIEQRDRLLRVARHSMSDQLKFGTAVPADSIDVSTNESNKVTELRLRDREKYLLAKIKKSLLLFESEDYGLCKECGAEITFARLNARPVAELCIDCKEEQERQEKQQKDPREESKISFF